MVLSAISWCISDLITTPDCIRRVESETVLVLCFNCAYLWPASCKSNAPMLNSYRSYRQSQVRKSTDSEAKWAECSLILGASCRVQVFLAWSSIAQLSRFVSEHSVCWRFGAWGPGFKSCIQQRNTTCLLPIWISLACARASKATKICISPEPGAKVNWQWGQVGWMLVDHRDELSSSSFF